MTKEEVIEEFERQVLQGFDKAARHTLGEKFPQIKRGGDDCDLSRILPMIWQQVGRLCERYGYEFEEAEKGKPLVEVFADEEKKGRTKE